MKRRHARSRLTDPSSATRLARKDVECRQEPTASLVRWSAWLGRRAWSGDSASGREPVAELHGSPPAATQGAAITSTPAGRLLAGELGWTTVVERRCWLASETGTLIAADRQTAAQADDAYAPNRTWLGAKRRDDSHRACGDGIAVETKASIHGHCRLVVASIKCDGWRVVA